MALLRSFSRAVASGGGGVSSSGPSAAAACALLRSLRGCSGAATADGGSSDSRRAGDPLSAQIMAEHGRLEALFDRYNEPGVDDQRKLRIAYEIIRALSVHAAKEEMVLYPTVAQHLGERAADHLVDEHQHLKQVLYEMDTLRDARNPRLKELVSNTIKLTRKHMRAEERDTLPTLARAVGPDGMEKLARQFDSARAAAPTRPHPAAPNRPPLNVAANATAVPLDLARDAIRFGPAATVGAGAEQASAEAAGQRPPQQ